MRQGHGFERPWLRQSSDVPDAALFMDKPVERLMGESLEAEYLNDDALGKALYAIYALTQ